MTYAAWLDVPVDSWSWHCQQAWFKGRVGWFVKIDEGRSPYAMFRVTDSFLRAD